jgi:hypothetical protein
MWGEGERRMPRKALACPHCDRRFALPAHLGRHMKTIHAAGGGAAAARPTGKRMQRRGRRAGSRTTFTAGDAMAPLIQSVQSARAEIDAQRTQLTSQIEALDRVLSSLGGQPSSAATARASAAARKAPRRGGRTQRGAAILGILQALDRGGPLKPAQVAEMSGVKPTTVSTTLDTLRKKSLAGRNAAGWSLTRAGRAELSKRQ